METLEDQLRRTTRNFTVRLPEDQLFSLGRDLALELVRAHAESPSRHPDLDPTRIPIVDGKPRMDGGSTQGDASGDLFELGALLCSLALGEPAEVSWRLDGPPPPPASTLQRRDVLLTLARPRRDTRFPNAQAAADALAAALFPPVTAPAPWPLFRGNPSRTGIGGSAPGTAFAKFAWAWDTPIGPSVASPLLGAGLVLCPTADGRLFFLDRSTGRAIHDLRVGSAVESSPALENGVVVLGNDDGELVAADVVTGSQRYRVTIGSLVRSSPLFVGERVFVGTVDAKVQGGLICFDTVKVKILWKAKLGAVFSSPCLADQRVLVGSDDGRLYALDADKGTIIWSYPLSAKARSTPSLVGDLVLIGDFTGRLSAVRAADGSPAWVAELRHPLYSSPCAVGGVVVVGCNEGHIHGVDLASGAARFEVPTRGPVVGSPSAIGDRLVVGSTDGELYLLDPDGNVLARQSVSKAGIQSSPALDGDFLCVASGSGVHAFRLVP